MSRRSKYQIIELIKNLMKLAASEKSLGNEDAATRIQERIDALRLKHDITQEIVIEDAPVDFDGEPYFTRDSPLFRRCRIFWQVVLGGSTALFFGCRTILFKNNNLQAVIGDEKGRKSAIECFHLLYEQGINEAKNYTASQTEPKKARLESQSFLLGFAFGVEQRFKNYKYSETRLTPGELEFGIELTRNILFEVPNQTGEIVGWSSREDLNLYLEMMDERRETIEKAKRRAVHQIAVHSPLPLGEVVRKLMHLPADELEKAAIFLGPVALDYEVAPKFKEFSEILAESLTLPNQKKAKKSKNSVQPFYAKFTKKKRR